MTCTEPNPERVLAKFEAAYRSDAASNGAKSLSEYLRHWPEHQDAVAKSYLRLQDEAAGGSADTVSSPDSLGPYVLGEVLGRGGQGTVYRARHRRTGRTVAVKVLQASGPGGERQLAYFKREAAIAARLDHPGLCPVYDAEVVGGVPYFAMRYVEGETLAQRITRGRGEQDRNDSGDSTFMLEVPVTGNESHQVRDGATPTAGTLTRAELMSAMRIVEKAARALHAAHEAGIVHRDIKPGNVMVTPEEEAVVMDFGLARADDADLHTLTRSGDLFGTPAYMSPEQLTRHTIKLDRRTDVWSLGVMLYECATLHRPFEAPTREAVYQAILNKDPGDPRKLNTAISRDLATVIATALEKDRVRRYQTALDLADDLKRALEFHPVVARPTSAWTRLLRWGQRNPALAFATTTAAVILVAGATVATRFAIVADANAELANAKATEAQSNAERANTALERERKAMAAAARQATIAEELFGFVTRDLLEAVDPDQAQGDEITVAQLLPGAEAKLADQDPEVELRLRLTFAELRRKLDDTAASRAHVERAVALLGELGRTGSAEHADVLETLANLEWEEGNKDRSIELMGEVVALRRRHLGDQHEDTQKAIADLEMFKEVAAGNMAVALDNKALLTVVAFARGKGETPQQVYELIEGMLAKAVPLWRQAKQQAAVQVVVDEGLKVRPYALPRVPYTLAGAANLLYGDGRKEAALIAAHAAVRIGLENEALGERHRYTLFAMQVLGGLYAAEGDAENAVSWSRRAYEQAVAGRGPTHSLAVSVGSAYVKVLIKLKRHDAALPLAENLLENARKGSESEMYLHHHAAVASALGKNDNERAAAHLEAALQVALKRHKPGHGNPVQIGSDLAVILRRLGREADAEKALERAGVPPSDDQEEPKNP